MKQWDVKSNISQPIVPQALGGLGITTSGSVLALLGRIVGDVHRLETYRTIIGDHRVSNGNAHRRVRGNQGVAWIREIPDGIRKRAA